MTREELREQQFRELLINCDTYFEPDQIEAACKVFALLPTTEGQKVKVKCSIPAVECNRNMPCSLCEYSEIEPANSPTGEAMSQKNWENNHCSKCGQVKGSVHICGEAMSREGQTGNSAIDWYEGRIKELEAKLLCQPATELTVEDKIKFCDKYCPIALHVRVTGEKESYAECDCEENTECPFRNVDFSAVWRIVEAK